MFSDQGEGGNFFLNFQQMRKGKKMKKKRFFWKIAWAFFLNFCFKNNTNEIIYIKRVRTCGVTRDGGGLRGIVPLVAILQMNYVWSEIFFYLIFFKGRQRSGHVGAKLIKGSSVPSPFFTCFCKQYNKVKVRVNVPIFIFFRREGGNRLLLFHEIFFLFP